MPVAQWASCALCGKSSLPANDFGRRVRHQECTASGALDLDAITTYVACENPKCHERISKDCYRLLRSAAMAAFNGAGSPADRARFADGSSVRNSSIGGREVLAPPEVARSRPVDSAQALPMYQKRAP